MRVIAVANQKGGCGKTTTSINLAACLAHLKKRVLLIDLDPQGHSTCGLGIRAEKLSRTLYELLRTENEESFSVSEVALPLNHHLHLLPATTSLAGIEEELVHVSGRERRLRQKICSPLQIAGEYEYIVIDCPPTTGVLTLNALEAADEVIIPIEPSFFSLHGLAKISETLERVNRRRRVPLQSHALLTIFDSRTRFAKEVYDEVQRHFRKKLFRAIIHESVSLKEAASAGQSIVDYAPDTQACRDYMNLALEYLERTWESLFPHDELGWGNVLRNRFGPKRAIGGVLFQCHSPGAQEVEVAGDFNRWIPEPMTQRAVPGVWQKIIPMEEGEFRYKFIVDGEWQLDPCQEATRENSYGSFDSFLKVI